MSAMHIDHWDLLLKRNSGTLTFYRALFTRTFVSCEAYIDVKTVKIHHCVPDGSG